MIGRQMVRYRRFPILQFHLQGNEIIAFVHRDGKTTVVVILTDGNFLPD
jgi:hypothetical protein